MKVAYWAMFHGQSKTTTNLMLTHIYNAFQTTNKQLIISNQFTYNLLDLYLGVNGDNSIGLDKLLNAIRNKDTKVINRIPDYTESYMKKNQFDLVPGTMHTRESAHKDIEELFIGLAEIADRVYDSVIIDVNAGDNPFNRAILSSVDKVFVSINQNEHLINQTLAKLKEMSLFGTDKVVYIIGDYNEDVKLTKRNIERKFGIRIVGIIPTSRTIVNAMNDNGLIEFINQNINVQDHDENYELMQELENIRKVL